MANILISYSDKQLKDLVDDSTNLRIVRTQDKIQFRVKNCFVPEQVLVIDSSIINDQEFIEWAIINTKLDLIVLIHDRHNIKLSLKDLKKQTKHTFQFIEKEIEPKDNIFGILGQIATAANRVRVKKTLEDSVHLFPLLLKWLIGSADKFSEENKSVIQTIDELYMRRNNESVIRLLAFGIKPEANSIRFSWEFPKAEDKKKGKARK